MNAVTIRRDPGEGAVRDRLTALLDTHAAARGFPFAREDLVLALEREGRVLGGLVARTNYGWLRIDLLAVDDALRGGGWGRKLVGEAETMARERGCFAAWVDTYSFQAPGFYERLGYTPFGELPDCPPGERRLFFWKRLDR